MARAAPKSAATAGACDAIVDQLQALHRVSFSNPAAGDAALCRLEGALKSAFGLHDPFKAVKCSIDAGG